MQRAELRPSSPNAPSTLFSVAAVPRTLLFSYHFHPSSEVGGRRTTALAQHLVARGTRPIVVSAFGGDGVAALDSDVRASLDGMTLVGISQPRSAMLKAGVRLKSTLRRKPSEPLNDSVTGGDGVRSPGVARSGVLSRLHDWLHRWFFGVLFLIDSHKKWTRIAARRAVAAARREGSEVVFVSGPPMSTIVGAAWIGRRMGLPVVVDLRDPCYPGAPPDGADWVTRLRAAVGHRIELLAVNRAAAIVCTSPGLAAALQSRYPRNAAAIFCIPNGFDTDAVGRPPPPAGVLSIVFAGELYVNRNPFAFLEAIDALARDPAIDTSRVRVLFVGTCDEFGGVRLRDWLRERRAGAIVEVRPPVGRRELDALYADATVLLNFAQGQPLQIPAKTFEQLASGRELILVTEATSDTARIVAGVSGVHRVDGADREGMLVVLQDLYRRHVVEGKVAAPRADEIQRFSRATQNERLATILTAAIRGRDVRGRLSTDDASATP